MFNYAKNFIILVLVALLVILPLQFNKEADFEGADGKAVDIIQQIQPEYQPWYKPLWEPPSGETESLLFAMQAALGAGFIGYYFGYKKGQKKVEHS